MFLKIKKLLAIKGKKTAVELHRELGAVMWESVGMARSRTGLEKAITRIGELRDEFWKNVTVPGTDADLNVALERANRVADFMEFGELLNRDTKGHYLSPALFVETNNSMRINREEIFGPVASVIKVDSYDEALKVANDTPFGLGSYLFTTDPEQAERVANQIDAGMVYVNIVGADGAELPLGGVKRSGWGRELGKYGMDEFVNKKLIRVG